MKARVQLRITTQVEVVDGGYLRNAPLEDHMTAARKEAEGYEIFLKRRPTEEPVKVEGHVRLLRVVIEEDEE